MSALMRRASVMASPCLYMKLATRHPCSQQYRGQGFHCGGGAGKANVQDLSFTKYVAAASSALMGHCASGKHIPEATLVVRKAGGDKALEYITVKMTDLLVTSVSTGGSGGEDRLTENVTLNFAKVKVDYKEQTATGTTGATPSMSYDIAQNVNE